eukprot:6617612-Pyramimonas_sp.AAC.1
MPARPTARSAPPPPRHACRNNAQRSPTSPPRGSLGSRAVRVARRGGDSRRGDWRISCTQLLCPAPPGARGT